MHFLNTIINGKTDPFFVSFFSLDKAGNVKYTEDVYTISQILDFDKVTGIYYFNPYKTHLRNYFYKCDGIRVIYENQLTYISSRKKMKVGIDPAGYFITDYALIFGYMGKEGVATMLPRFWEPPNNSEK